MVVHSKVIAPRIVQENPARRMIWLVLVITGFLLVAWIGYEYGRSEAPAPALAPAPAGEAISQGGESQQLLSALEQERNTLKSRIAELELDIEGARRALDEARSRISILEAEKSPSDKIPETAKTTQVSDETDSVLQVEDVYIESTDSDNVFRYRFSVKRSGNSNDRVTGTIWIAINGFSNGEPTRLSLKRVSADRRSFVKMGFTEQQDVEGEVTLPEGFEPKNIMIEAKPYDKKYKETSEKFDWVTAG